MTRYAPFYCEENVWWLAREEQLAARSPEVLVISNARRAVPMWSQRAAKVEGAPVVWDYHVVLAVRGADGVEVWDLDCTRGAPIPADAWLEASFRPDVPRPLAPLFRPIPADVFARSFASDRRHMRTRAGRWRAAPPPWPIIGGGAHVLDSFVDVQDETFGPACDLTALRERWR